MAEAGAEPEAVDAVVVGAGAAGLAAATTLARAGRSVALVSAGPLGGDCTWHGCVPTKALLEAAAAGLDAAAAVAHARRCVAHLARLEGPAVLAGAGVHVVPGRVVLRHREGVVEVHAPAGPATVRRPRLGVVLATGSVPLADVPGLPEPLPPGVRVTTTEGWLDALAEHVAAGAPGPVVVVGGGPSGSELAQGLARSGLRVRLLERSAALLPGLPGAGEVVARSLRADGVEVVLGAGAEHVADAVVPGALVLVCAGRRPALGVLDGWDGPPLVRGGGGGVAVDGSMRTAVPGLVAAGDVTGLLPTTHVAAATGRVAAATLLGLEAAHDPLWAPRVVLTDPEVAAVGTLAGPRHARVALARGDRAVLADLPGRAGTGPGTGPGAGPWVRGGSARLWTEPDGRVRGALVVGPHAGELVAEVALVGRLGLTVADWVGGIAGVGGTAGHHAYPTWSWVWEAVADRLLRG